MRKKFIFYLQWLLSRNYFLTLIISIILTPFFMVCIATQGIIDAFRETHFGEIIATRDSFSSICRQYEKEKERRRRINHQ